MAPPRKYEIEIGQRFGRGTVTDAEVRYPRVDRPSGERGARLLCDCGAEYVALVSFLYAGLVQSCGCLHSEVAAANMRRHHGSAANAYQMPPVRGLAGHSLRHTWSGMLSRCENPRDKRYSRYGGRGIAVCERWHDIRLFVEDIEREIGTKPAKCPECGGRYSLDRIDGDRGYEPGNVRWATATEQNRNKA